MYIQVAELSWDHTQESLDCMHSRFVDPHSNNSTKVLFQSYRRV